MLEEKIACPVCEERERSEIRQFMQTVTEEMMAQRIMLSDLAARQTEIVEVIEEQEESENEGGDGEEGESEEGESEGGESDEEGVEILPTDDGISPEPVQPEVIVVPANEHPFRRGF